MAKPPSMLIESFRASAERDVEAIACLLIEDGFDAMTMRVLAAWPQLELEWEQPDSPCPDNMMPTNAAWRWLIAGLRFDAQKLATVAGVSAMVARAKATMLLGNRLAFPDGTITKVARGALQQHARRALGLKQQKAEKKKASERTSDEDEGSN